MLSVYIASAYDSAPEVRAIHRALRILGCAVHSDWAEDAAGPEDLDALTDEQALELHRRNHEAAANADVVIVRADSRGRETFAEAQSAFGGRARIVWVGRPTLSARVHSPRVTLVQGDCEAIALVALAAVKATPPVEPWDEAPLFVGGAS